MPVEKPKKYTADLAATIGVLLIVGAIIWISSLNGQVAELKGDVSAWQEGAEMTNDSINDAKYCDRCSYDELKGVIDNIRYAERY